MGTIGVEFLGSIPAAICGGLDAIGGNCDSNVLVIKVWHFFPAIFVFALVTSIVYFIRRHDVLHRQHNLLEMSSERGASPEVRTIRVNPRSFAEALKEKGYEQLNPTNAAKKLNEKYGDRYFVCQFREGGKRMFRRELKIRAWHINLKSTEFQLDPETLDLLKKASISKLDDELGDSYGADGTFDIFFRPVKWWDIRHWLNHPAREIRYALYIAIFAAFLEYSSDIIDMLRTLFRTP